MTSPKCKNNLSLEKCCVFFLNQSTFTVEAVLLLKLLTQTLKKHLPWKNIQISKKKDSSEF